MEPGKLKAFIERVAGLPEGMSLSSLAIAQTPGKLKVIDSTAVIAISGVLLKTVPGWIRFFGIEATGYDEIRSQIDEAVANKSVANIHLQVDSPGGMVAGVISTSDAIFNARQAKPVTATIEDLGASAAYWLVSQADSIDANRNTETGAIGVFAVLLDFSKQDEDKGIKVVVIRSGEHKGTGIDKVTDNQIAAIQEIIDAKADNFIDSIARGRGRASDEIRKLATGQLWIAGAALELGLIDSVRDDREQTNENQTESKIKGETLMKEQEESQADAVDTEQIRKEAAAGALEAERARIAAINKAFADDPAFANKAIADGLSVEQASAEYVDVLRARLKEQADQAASAESQAANTDADAIATEGTDGDGSGDFLAEARELAAEKKISMTAAMQRLNRTKPALHAAFRAKCATQGRDMYAQAV
jgi:signal peptide peptidase SppA